MVVSGSGACSSFENTSKGSFLMLCTTEPILQHVTMSIWGTENTQNHEYLRWEGLRLLMWIFKILKKMSFCLSGNCVKSELTTPNINKVRMTFRKYWQPVFFNKNKTDRKEYIEYPFNVRAWAFDYWFTVTYVSARSKIGKSSEPLFRAKRGFFFK